MKNVTFTIDGMQCNGCATCVRSLLERQAGVKAVQVSLEQGLAQVLFDPQTVSEPALVAVIEDAGYQVRAAVVR